MSKNNTIKKSDKTFIRREKARIRGQFLDVKKQEELITELYKKFSNQSVVAKTAEINNKEAKEVKIVKKEDKKPKVKSEIQAKQKHEK